jgi:hypothetical protein
MNMYMPGDKVNYVGQKFSQELRTKLGVVVSKVQGEPYGVVVDFGENSYIVNINSLKRANVSRDVEVDIERTKRYSSYEEAGE